MSHSAAFAENKQEMLSYTGISSIAPATNNYGVNATPEIITAANDEKSPSVAMNATSGVSGMMPAPNANNTNINANNDNVVGSAFLAGSTLADKGLEGIQAKSANVITPNMSKQDGIGYMAESTLSTMSSILGSLGTKEPEMEMAAAAPQPPKFQPGVFGL